MNLLTPAQLHPYQQKAVNFQCTSPESMLWLDMGLGKTAITLTSLSHLLGQGFLRGVVIVAPIRVCRLVWRQEAAKWSHTKHLRFSMLTGTKDQRTRALLRPADVFLINYENLGWLAEVLNTYYVSKGRPVPFNGLVWDEISKCFAAGTQITTENSTIAIDKLNVGDMVMTHLGLRRVTDVMCRTSRDMVSVNLSNGQSIHCTQDHPFLLDGRWEAAGNLKEGDFLYGAPHSEVRTGGVFDMRNALLEAQGGANDLFKGVLGQVENARPLGEEPDNQWGHQGASATQGPAWCLEQGGTLVRGRAREDERVSQEGESRSPQRRERCGRVAGGKPAEDGSTGSLCAGVRVQDAVSPTGLSDSLQTRLRRSGSETGDRGSRPITPHRVGETKGLEKADILGKVRVDSVVRHERGGDVDVWNISVEEAETYFAGGVLVHNCKNSTTQRVKSTMKILNHFAWVTGLTGTPASNGYQDLHGQYLVVDKGKRLGTSKTKFMTEWYRKPAEGSRKVIAYKDTEDRIKHLIGDITLEMSAADYNPLPDLMVNNVEVEMPAALRARYDVMEKDFFLQLDSGKSKEVFNQASLTNTCLQFSNGAVYPVAGMPLWEPIHDLKLDALEELIDEANGQPILCSYAYRSDASRIMTRFAHLDPINLTECKSEASLNEAMARWKSGRCALMIGHPASMGHGIDGLQDVGHMIVWFGLTWSLDMYDQMNARLRRQGQGVPVICHRITMRDTLDQAQALSLDDKAVTQQSLRNAVKTYRLSRGV